MIFSRVLSNKDTYHSDYLDEDVVDFLGPTFNIPRVFDAALVETEDGYQARPDLISKVVFMDEMYEDIICKLNNVSNPFEIDKDSKMVLPVVESLREFVVEPDRKWHEGVEVKKRPVPKKRSQQRKPNEAVVGDKRFYINVQDGIIVY